MSFYWEKEAKLPWHWIGVHPAFWDENAEVSRKSSICEEVKGPRNKITSEIKKNIKNNFSESSGTIVSDAAKHIAWTTGSALNQDK